MFEGAGMIDDSFDELVREIKKTFRRKKEAETIILFGSVARGDAGKESDLDLCVVYKKGGRKTISDIILDMEKKYNKNMNVIFTDSEFKDLNRQFIETIIKEGIVLKGDMPKVSVQRLELEPYELMSYDLTSLSQTDKMRIKRLLYGSTSKKKYKDRVYESKKKGLVKKTKGIRVGKASIIIPERHASEVEMALRDYGVKLRKYTIWISKT
jgi:predicted nucleotidyltransferase